MTIKIPAKAKIVLFIAGIILTFLSIFVFLFFYNPPKELRAYFLDVGQGDSILIRSPYGQNILIDGGPDKSILKELGKILPWWDRRVDLMVLTHPHDDHVAGLANVIKRYKTKKILYTGVSHTSPAYLEWLDLARQKKLAVAIIDRPQAVSLGDDCRLEILYPAENLAGRTVDNLNNTSIVIKLIYGRTKFLLMGDAENEAENKLMASVSDLKVDVLKIGHHGADDATSEEFLKAVSPQIAVIEVGKDNDFGHPSPRILKRLERLGARIFRADADGTVVLVSNGEKIERR